ncbi:MAG: indole-3-glycerol phosphate synthase TrpC [Bacteroidetes bacterium]|nr:indole-3-glycerol phosphate synthase TrpC [Bacteroidota bacterium]
MSILNEIILSTRQDIAELKRIHSLSRLKDMPCYYQSNLSLAESLSQKNPGIIAEIKKASPSKGIIRKDFDHRSIAAGYAENGAGAISILTEKKHFLGDIKYISDVRPKINIPILRKDFIIDPYQLTEAKAYGADAVLLIAAALEPNQLHDFHDEAAEIGLDCLVEVHNEKELEKLDFSQVRIIGINNRNLSDFTVDIKTSIRLSSLIPKDILIVSESGISNSSDIKELMKQGIFSFLIGESFMRAESPGKALKILLGSVQGN